MKENLKDFIIPRYSGAGIYTFVNTDKMIAYVGQSHNIKDRATTHLYGISNGKHQIEEVNRDKEDHFIFTVLYKIPKQEESKEKLDFLEKIFMLAMLDRGLYLYNKSNINDINNINYLAMDICIDMMLDIGATDIVRDIFYTNQGTELHHLIHRVRKKYSEKH